MTTRITQLAQQAQATTANSEQLEKIILILQDAIRRLKLLET